MPNLIAVISDVHGNRWALEAVLDDLGRRGPDTVVNLGDCLYGPLDPAGTADLLHRLDAPTVRGNEDRLLAELPPGAALPPTLRFVLGRIGREEARRLGALPATRVVVDELFCCHGSPHRDDEYLLRRLAPDGSVKARDAQEVAGRLGTVTQPVILCGHDHVPASVRLPDGGLVVNPGSVGLPAYSDTYPRPHVMEAGTPHARYALLSRTPDGWKPEHVSVAYDWTAAAEAAEANGRPDWAAWLRTGRASV
jgi:predicted phosphodiesterase